MSTLYNFLISKVPALDAFAKNKTVKAFSIYFSTTFISKVFYFLSFIVFSHYLSKDDLGHLSIYNNTVTLLIGFVTWGIIYNISTDFFRFPPEQFSSKFKSVIILPLINTIIITILLIITFGVTSKQFGFTVQYLWLIPLTLIFNFIYDVGLNILRNKLMQREFAYASLLKLFVELVLAFLFILVFRLGWQGRIFSILISFIIPALFFLWFYYKQGYLNGPVSTKHWKPELIGFAPILVMQVCIFMLNGSDEFFINHFENASRTGLFSVATNLSSVIIVVNGAIYLAIIPQVYKNLAEHKNYTDVMPKFLQYILIHLVFLLAICIMIWICYTYLIHKSFYPAIGYSYITLAGYFFWSISNFFLSIYLFLKLFRVILAISVVSVTFTFSCHYYLIKHYSLLGASISIVISNLFLLLILVGGYQLILKGIIKDNFKTE